MTAVLQPGHPLVVAPRFHLAIDWAERLSLGGVVEEDGCFYPRGPWRRPSAEELALLVGDPTAITRDEAQARAVCLFGLPQHLRASFEALLVSAQETGGLDGLDSFTGELARFLEFKGLAVPSSLAADVVVGRPGLPSVQWDEEAGRPLGLTFSFAAGVPWPTGEGDRWPRLWGGINLGDEAVSLVLVNLPGGQVAEAVSATGDVPATTDELGRRFLALRQAECPVVRVSLGPGEGYTVPAAGLIVDVCTLEMQSPALLLMLRTGDGDAPEAGG